jgi:hypothetical protein
MPASRSRRSTRPLNINGEISKERREAEEAYRKSSSETKEVIEEAERNSDPVSGELTPVGKARVADAIANDSNLDRGEKTVLSEWILGELDRLITEDLSDDYEQLKWEAKFYASLTEKAFVVMALRLRKIRDGELYLSDGYNSFSSFIAGELDSSRTTAYRYMQLTDHYTPAELHRVEHPSRVFEALSLLSYSKDRLSPENYQEVRGTVLEQVEDTSVDRSVLRKELKRIAVRYKIPRKANSPNAAREIVYQYKGRALVKVATDAPAELLSRLDELLEEYEAHRS